MRPTKLRITLTSLPFNSVSASEKTGVALSQGSGIDMERSSVGHAVVMVIAHILMFLAITSGLGTSLFAQSNKPNESQKISRQSPEAMAAVLKHAQKSDSLFDATIELTTPLDAGVIENVVISGQIRSLRVTSTNFAWKGGINATDKSPIKSLSEGLRRYEKLYRDSGPEGRHNASFAITAFTFRSVASEVFRVRDSFSAANLVSVVDSSEESPQYSLRAQKGPGTSKSSPEQGEAFTAPDRPFVPSNAELKVQTLANSHRKIEVKFSWNSSEDLAGLDYDRSTLEVQVLFWNHAMDPKATNFTYVGPVIVWGTDPQLAHDYLDTLALNKYGLAGQPTEHEVTLGSANARSDFQAGRQYSVWAITQGGALDANFAKLSFQRGIFNPDGTESFDAAKVAAFCAAHFVTTGVLDPSSCTVGLNTKIVTPVNYTDTTFSILAPTVPSFTYPTHTCEKPPGYPFLGNGVRPSAVTESLAVSFVPRILAFQTLFSTKGGSSVVGCPTGFVHVDAAWWPRGGRTQDFDGGQGGKGAILLAPDSSVAFWIHAGFWLHYEALGGPKSVLGEPTGNEEAVTSSRGTKGSRQGFTGGWLYYDSSKNETFRVLKGIADKYKSVGFHDDPLGFPTSNEYPWGGGARNNFEGGYIFWTAAGGAVIVRDPFYAGHLDYQGCDVIRGWAADRIRLNTVIDVKIYDGATLIATVPANELRSDVGSFIGDNGLHGFNIPTPASLKDGQPHTLSLKFESSTEKLGGVHPALTCTTTPGIDYAGHVDYQGCDVIRGWAADRERPNTVINVKIYDGATLIATVPANESRSDVGSFLGDNGLHGFNIPTPASLKNGQPHTLSVKFESSTQNLGGVHPALTCASTTPGPNYAGYVDYQGCDVIRGWAADRNRLNTAIDVKIYDGATLIATVPANQARTDVGSFLGDNGLHGFNIPTPASLKNGQPHTLSVKFESSTQNLGGVHPALTCASTTPGPNYAGYVDYQGCDVIRGWAADRNRLNTAIDVKIYDGATLIATVPANQARTDVGSFLGDNGLHGFNIPTPASLKNGQPHTLSVKFESSTQNLGGVHPALTCASTTPGPNYAGYVDYQGCDVIRGWAADRNRLNTAIDVKIYDGATLIATVPANQARTDVGSFLGDNGLHGFNIPTPASLKNGQPHTLSVKFESSTQNLGGVHPALTCASPGLTPQVSSISPNPVPTFNANQNVGVFGNNFQSGLTVDVFNISGVKIGTLSGSQIQNLTATSFTMVISLGSMASTFGIEVVNSSGARSQRFTFSTTAASPSISSMSPSSPQAVNSNQNVQVSGSNFQFNLTVDVFNGSGTKIGTLSGSQILNVAPSSFTMVINVGSIAGNFGLEVINPSGARSARFSFSTQAAKPSVGSISPNPVPTFNANQNVQVSGGNFQTGLIVDVFNSAGTKVGTLSGTQIKNVTSTSFTMVISLGSSASTFGIEVVNSGGNRSSRFSFSTTTPTPSVSSISPNPVPVFNGNQNVQVSGSNFQSGLIVDVFNSAGTKLGTLSGSQVLNTTPTSFTMVINLGSTAGTFGIEVLNPSTRRSSRFTFTTR